MKSDITEIRAWVIVIAALNIQTTWISICLIILSLPVFIKSIIEFKQGK